MVQRDPNDDADTVELAIILAGQSKAVPGGTWSFVGGKYRYVVWEGEHRDIIWERFPSFGLIQQRIRWIAIQEDGLVPSFERVLVRTRVEWLW